MSGIVALALGLALLATPALAYIGPGAGITMLSALWGVVVAIVLALAAILLWPMRMLLRRRRKAARPVEGGGAADLVGAAANPSNPDSGARRDRESVAGI
jgi:hypothetical protein